MLLQCSISTYLDKLIARKYQDHRLSCDKGCSQGQNRYLEAIANMI